MIWFGGGFFILYKMLIGQRAVGGAELLFNGCEAATPNEATARTDTL